MTTAPESDREILLLRGGGKTFAAWHDALASAEAEVLFEMYWFASDETGREIAGHLSECARRGLDVRVIYDSIGSIDSDSRMFASMREAGVQVLEHNPVAPWNGKFSWSRIGLRDHRKLLVVDGRVAFVGGINAAHVSAPKAKGGQGWRDDSVRVSGLAARELRRLFIDTWKGFGGPPVPRPPPALPASSLAGRASEVMIHPTIETELSIHRVYLDRIRLARQRILIANAYFLPSPKVRRALRRAARRHVDVRILVPERSDVRIVDYATSVILGSLVRSGCDVRLYRKAVLHSKTAVIDDWATVGSYNFDNRSRQFNLEVNVGSRDEIFVQAMVDGFEKDFSEARPVSHEELENRAPYERALGWVFWRLRGHL